jgi:hypothetical protein
MGLEWKPNPRSCMHLSESERFLFALGKGWFARQSGDSPEAGCDLSDLSVTEQSGPAGAEVWTWLAG